MNESPDCEHRGRSSQHTGIHNSLFLHSSAGSANTEGFCKQPKCVSYLRLFKHQLALCTENSAVIRDLVSRWPQESYPRIKATHQKSICWCR